MTEATKCRADAFHANARRFGRWMPCSRKAVRDGYCTQHHPDTKAAKGAAWRAKFNAAQVVENARYAQQSKERAVLAAAKAWRQAPDEASRGRALADMMAAACAAWPKVSP